MFLTKGLEQPNLLQGSWSPGSCLVPSTAWKIEKEKDIKKYPWGICLFSFSSVYKVAPFFSSPAPSLLFISKR